MHRDDSSLGPAHKPHQAAAASLPPIEEIRATWARIGRYLRETPTWTWRDPVLERAFPSGAEVSLKLELFQVTGTFKARGALAVVTSLTPAQLRRGVTAVSAGNHAVAVSFAASVAETDAVVVMPKSANPARVALCRAFGATVRLMDDVNAAFTEVSRLEKEEGRSFVHPFESEATILGTGTIGLEWVAQCPDLDALVVPIGGGGLMAGIAATVKQLRPACSIYGVEPAGANLMSQSITAGHPVSGPVGGTIADSLDPPFTLPYSFGLCRSAVDHIVTVTDDELCLSLYLLFRSAKLAVEPAGAAATAALLGPLRERLAGKRVGVLVCGANVDPNSYETFLQRGQRLVAEPRGEV